MKQKEPNSTAFFMADVRHKRPTARRAVARGSFFAGKQVFDLISRAGLPKGDALLMAEIAGIQGAKQASNLMPLCHPLPLELVRTRYELDAQQNAVHIYCEVATHAKTGVEMEALAGVNAALLTLYDLSKPIDPALQIGQIRLLFKEGGKKGTWIHPDGMSQAEREHYRPSDTLNLDGHKAAIITLSDRASRGDYPDQSGEIIVQRLQAAQVHILAKDLLADELQPLMQRLQVLAESGADLIICTGGTGLGPRDITSEAIDGLPVRDVPGVANYFRNESTYFTQSAVLSRARCAVLGKSLIIALPGSPKAVTQGLDILLPLLPHALAMIKGQGH